MKHPSRWNNNFARRTVLVLVTLTLVPVSLLFGAFYGMWEVMVEWENTFVKVWRRSNDAT